LPVVRWTSSLTNFLRYLVKHFCKRIVAENSPPSSDTSDAISDGASEDAGAMEELALPGMTAVWDARGCQHPAPCARACCE
jgi:hypothetical protein